MIEIKSGARWPNPQCLHSCPTSGRRCNRQPVYILQRAAPVAQGPGPRLLHMSGSGHSEGSPQRSDHQQVENRGAVVGVVGASRGQQTQETLQHCRHPARGCASSSGLPVPQGRAVSVAGHAQGCSWGWEVRTAQSAEAYDQLQHLLTPSAVIRELTSLRRTPDSSARQKGGSGILHCVGTAVSSKFPHLLMPSEKLFEVHSPDLVCSAHSSVAWNA